MKKSFITAIIMLWTMFVMAQSQKIHVVQRGETFASIASKYGMTESELRNANPNVKNCYSGTKLNVGKRIGSQETTTMQNKSIATNNETTLHDKVEPSVLSSNTIKSESRPTSSPIDKYLSLSQSLINNKKYKKATKWIELVLNDDRCTAEQNNKAKKMLAQIENAKEERRERLSAFFDNLETGLKKAEQSLRVMSQNAYEIDAIQRGTNVPNRTPVSTYNNRSSQIINNGIDEMKRYAENVLAKADEDHAKFEEEQRKIKEEKEKIYNKALELYNGGNYTEALKWFKKAAENGNIEAQYKVGDMYAEGKGVEKNNTIAERWYRQAEENQRYAHESILQLNNRQSQTSTPIISSESTVKKEKSTCTWCNGTGLTLKSISCPTSIFGCVDVYCSQCAKTHCRNNTNHKKCVMCDGTGKRDSY
ncbi:MAG: SEL1-like repeat protein [Prevotella sp.]|nr:SEL1-like repeat protein [Prevotella sp.]